MPKPFDTIARMHARRQIDKACFAAARDYQRATAAALQQIEARLVQRVGGEGCQLVRDILGGATIEAAARERGEGDRLGVAWWGAFFRHSLRHLAEVTGRPA